MAAVATVLCGGGVAVAVRQRFGGRRAAPSLSAGGVAVMNGANVVRGRQLLPALFLAPSLRTLSSSASRQQLRAPASASSSDSTGLVSISCLPAAYALCTVDP